MKFTLTIELGNEAMQSHEDIARALEDVIERLRLATHVENGSIRDDNGNTVGRWGVA
jgi:hypothetical protein